MSLESLLYIYYHYFQFPSDFKMKLILRPFRAPLEVPWVQTLCPPT